MTPRFCDSSTPLYNTACSCLRQRKLCFAYYSRVCLFVCVQLDKLITILITKRRQGLFIHIAAEPTHRRIIPLPPSPHPDPRAVINRLPAVGLATSARSTGQAALNSTVNNTTSVSTQRDIKTTPNCGRYSPRNVGGGGESRGPFTQGRI